MLMTVSSYSYSTYDWTPVVVMQELIGAGGLVGVVALVALNLYYRAFIYILFGFPRRTN